MKKKWCQNCGKQITGRLASKRLLCDNCLIIEYLKLKKNGKKEKEEEKEINKN